MKIFVVHGDDTEKSYARLSKFIDTAKERSWEVVYVNSDSRQSLAEIVSSTSLFAAERFFIVKDFKIIKPKEFEWVNKHQDGLVGNLVIYSEGTIPATTIKKLKNVQKVEEFKLPKIIFQFLDAFYPKNKILIKMFSELTGKDSPEFAFALLARHVRDLYWAKMGNPPYPSWRAGKLNSQTNKFEDDKLKSIISELSLIDYKAKTGRGNLKDELDLLMLTKLQ